MAVETVERRVGCLPIAGLVGRQVDRVGMWFDCWKARDALAVLREKAMAIGNQNGLREGDLPDALAFWRLDNGSWYGQKRVASLALVKAGSDYPGQWLGGGQVFCDSDQPVLGHIGDAKILLTWLTTGGSTCRQYVLDLESLAGSVRGTIGSLMMGGLTPGQVQESRLRLGEFEKLVKLIG